MNQLIKRLLDEGFYKYSEVSPNEHKRGDRFICVCKSNDTLGKEYLFYAFRYWSSRHCFVSEVLGEEEAEVLFFKPLPSLSCWEANDKE